MTKQQVILLGVAIAMMGGVGGALNHIHAHQRLGEPGVKTRPLAGSRNVEVMLPERVLDYSSEALPLAEVVTNTLPKDTSFGQRAYRAPDGFELLLNVVLMGGDRTSLHKPQFCLTGSGWNIDSASSMETKVPMERPCQYDLPVVKLIASKPIVANGQNVMARGVYVYYFVADDAISAGILGYQRMWWMARDLFRTGVLQRWAYVSYFAICPPGGEEATFERMKKFIAASAPEFQLAPRPGTDLSAK